MPQVSTSEPDGKFELPMDDPDQPIFDPRPSNPNNENSQQSVAEKNNIEIFDESKQGTNSVNENGKTTSEDNYTSYH